MRACTAFWMSENTKKKTWVVHLVLSIMKDMQLFYTIIPHHTTAITTHHTKSCFIETRIFSLRIKSFCDTYLFSHKKWQHTNNTDSDAFIVSIITYFGQDFYPNTLIENVPIIFLHYFHFSLNFSFFLNFHFILFFSVCVWFGIPFSFWVTYAHIVMRIIRNLKCKRFAWMNK